MTRIHVIHAGPTPWDEENRLVGNHSLPLAPSALASIKQLADSFPGLLTCIYVDKTNEAAITAGKMLASKFKLRTRHSADLAEVNLGLWQGLDRPTLRTRFESSFPQWEQSPLTVTPPQGESLEQAVERMRSGLKKILRRNRGVTIAIPARPLAMRIMIGILKAEPVAQIAGRLHEIAAIETIELTDAQVMDFIK